MNENRDTLLNHLDQSIAAFAAVRRPDTVCTVAYDTLKQARALIARALSAERETLHSVDSRPTAMAG